MAAGVWSMDDDGNFELQEPYKTMLLECKMQATNGWRKEIYTYLTEHSPYTPDQLDAELIRRVQETGVSAVEIVDEFVIEALSGDLIPHTDEE